jgi:hypothetical protein
MPTGNEGQAFGDVGRYSLMLRAMARRATGLRRNARRAVEREMEYRLPSGERVADLRRNASLAIAKGMRAEIDRDRARAERDRLAAAIKSLLRCFEPGATGLQLLSLANARVVLADLDKHPDDEQETL